jgi:hypothetical protein
VVIDARPNELRQTTNSICNEKPSCALTWLSIKAKHPVIEQTLATNDQLEFRGMTSVALIPLSSSELGRKVIEQLRSLSNLGCH